MQSQRDLPAARITVGNLLGPRRLWVSAADAKIEVPIGMRPRCSHRLVQWGEPVVTPEHRFWMWFRENEDSLLDFECDRDRIFSALAAALAAVAADLSFEFGPRIDGRRDFVISAGGIKSAFAAVTALVAAAPVLPHWNVIAFRPRRAAMMAISFGGRTVRPEDVEFCVLSNGRELGLYLFFDGYRESERAIWGQIGYLLLDQALGEHDVEAKVGSIQFLASSAHPEAARYPLPELPGIFDARFAALPRRQ